MILGPLDSASSNGNNGRNGDDASEEDQLLSKLRALKVDGISRSEAVKLVVEMTGVPKSTVYKLALDEPWPGRGK